MIWRATVLGVVSIAGGWVGLDMSQRDVPTVIRSMGAVNAEVPRGGSAEVYYNALRKESCNTHINRFLFDAVGHRLVIGEFQFPAGALPIGEDRYMTRFTVPQDTALGQATYRTINTYKCNAVHWIWPVVDTPRDIPFKIVPAAPDK